MDTSETIVCFPGDRLCASNENTIAGVGTYERNSYIFASLAGTVETTNEDKVRSSHALTFNSNKIPLLESSY